MRSTFDEETLPGSSMDIEKNKEHDNEKCDRNIDCYLQGFDMPPERMKLSKTGVANGNVEQILAEISQVRSDEKYPDIELDDAGGDRDRGGRYERDETKQKEHSSVFPVVAGKTLPDVFNFLMLHSEKPSDSFDEKVLELVAYIVVERRADYFSNVSNEDEPD